jgi:hypothetical protein
MADDTISIPWPLPLTLEVIVNLADVALDIESFGVQLRTPILLRNTQFIVNLDYKAQLQSASPSTPFKHDSGRVAVEMLITYEVHRRLGIILDQAAVLARDHSEYRRDRIEAALGQPLGEMLDLGKRWNPTLFSEHFVFDVYDIGLASPISTKALIIAIGVGVLGGAQVINAVNDVVEAAKYVNNGIQHVLQTTETNDYRKSMKENLFKEMGEQARAHRYKLLQDLLKDVGYDPGPDDGVLGPQTSKAAADFGKAMGLPPKLGPQDAAFQLALAEAAAARLPLPGASKLTTQ